MSGPGSTEFEPIVIEVAGAGSTDDADDAIAPRRERTDWWRSPRNFYVIALALLVVAVFVAYQLDHNRKKGAAGPSPAPSVPAASPSIVYDRVPVIAATGRQCASQIGPQQLQLGIEIVNQSAQPVTLMNLTSTLPLGGLRETAQAVGTCGQLSLTTPVAGISLAPTAAAWVTMSFDVLVDCPTAYPVQFTFVIAQGGTGSTVNLGGFVDLGGVSYSGCAASPS